MLEIKIMVQIKLRNKIEDYSVKRTATGCKTKYKLNSFCTSYSHVACMLAMIVE